MMTRQDQYSYKAIAYNIEKTYRPSPGNFLFEYPKYDTCYTEQFESVGENTHKLDQADHY